MNTSEQWDILLQKVILYIWSHLPEEFRDGGHELALLVARRTKLSDEVHLALELRGPSIVNKHFAVGRDILASWIQKGFEVEEAYMSIPGASICSVPRHILSRFTVSRLSEREIKALTKLSLTGMEVRRVIPNAHGLLLCSRELVGEK